MPSSSSSSSSSSESDTELSRKIKSAVVDVDMLLQVGTNSSTNKTICANGTLTSASVVTSKPSLRKCQEFDSGNNVLETTPGFREHLAKKMIDRIYSNIKFKKVKHNPSDSNEFTTPHASLEDECKPSVWGFRLLSSSDPRNVFYERAPPTTRRRQVPSESSGSGSEEEAEKFACVAVTAEMILRQRDAAVSANTTTSLTTHETGSVVIKKDSAKISPKYNEIDSAVINIKSVQLSTTSNETKKDSTLNCVVGKDFASKLTSVSHASDKLSDKKTSLPSSSENLLECSGRKKSDHLQMNNNNVDDDSGGINAQTVAEQDLAGGRKKKRKKKNKNGIVKINDNNGNDDIGGISGKTVTEQDFCMRKKKKKMKFDADDSGQNKISKNDKLQSVDES